MRERLAHQRERPGRACGSPAASARYRSSARSRAARRRAAFKPDQPPCSACRCRYCLLKGEFQCRQKGLLKADTIKRPWRALAERARPNRAGSTAPRSTYDRCGCDEESDAPESLAASDGSQPHPRPSPRASAMLEQFSRSRRAHDSLDPAQVELRITVIEASAGTARLHHHEPGAAPIARALAAHLPDPGRHLHPSGDRRAQTTHPRTLLRHSEGSVVSDSTIHSCARIRARQCTPGLVEKLEEPLERASSDVDEAPVLTIRGSVSVPSTPSRAAAVRLSRSLPARLLCCGDRRRLFHRVPSSAEAQERRAPCSRSPKNRALGRPRRPGDEFRVLPEHVTLELPDLEAWTYALALCVRLAQTDRATILALVSELKGARAHRLPGGQRDEALSKSAPGAPTTLRCLQGRAFTRSAPGAHQQASFLPSIRSTPQRPGRPRRRLRGAAGEYQGQVQARS